MIVLDTTILLYASGSEHPLCSPCQSLVAAIAEGTVEATTTPEVIQELAHVRARRLGRREAVRTARDFASLLGPLIVVDDAVLTLGLRLFEEIPEIGSFDAVLASATITWSAEALVSADRGFGAVKGLVHLDPSAQDFLERAGASTREDARSG
jgi:uncharacterized protein